MPPTISSNTLFYGDNLEVLRKYINDESIDLCYIDPPFNSKRNYNQIYNNVGTEDRAQAQAFIDTWVWDEQANEGFTELLANDMGRFTTKTIDLIKGLHAVLGKGSLLAYLISMTIRITEIHRILKETGSFYLHCDPTASHYLKIILDSLFGPKNFRNEIVWKYTIGGRTTKAFPQKHDIILWYSKHHARWTFNGDDIKIPYEANMKTLGGVKRIDENGRPYRETWGTGSKKVYRYYLDEGKIPEDVWEFESINSNSPERLGYPTQKPQALLDRIIQASSNEGDMVLDAYCGCGTTVAVAELLKRKWIGIDITYQSISLILRRLESQHGKDVLTNITLNGIPQDMASARALAVKQDDRVRKEFEKWAVLTYSNNRAIINDKKGGDKGIDGTGFFLTNKDTNAKVVFQVKSGNVGRGDISKFNNDRTREGAELGVFLTLQPPTQGMKDEANAAGLYEHILMSRNYPRIQIVTIQEILEQNKHLDIPMSLEVLKKAQTASQNLQTELFQNEEHL
jgi:site-specific DNA-methyltransferase (adenine-specific)